MTYNCTVGDNATCADGGDGVCVNAGWGNVCLDFCGTTPDCRSAEGYVCGPAFATNICYLQHLTPGSACTTSSECGPPPWECLMGTIFPGGYCSADLCRPGIASDCPSGTLCYDPSTGVDGDEYCAKTCTGPTECTRPGYQCLFGPGTSSTCRTI